jgi:aspartyl-tRNA(Asn)/glutamyl-tRNA(Gln) amidotransferase subunit B
VKWQIDTLENGGKIHQATVLFDPDKGETHAMRSKEEAHDYRYFPDPDLLPLDISEEWKEQVRAILPELPKAKQARYISNYALLPSDAAVLTSSREMADLFEGVVKHLLSQGVGILTSPETPSAEAHAGQVAAKLVANWISGEVNAQLNRDGLDMTQCPITPQQLGGMLKRITDGTISNSGAKEVFRIMWSEGGDADSIIEAKGLKQVSDKGAIEALVDEIIAANPAQVADYRSGKDKLFGFFVGLAMKASKGKANPAQLNEVLKRKLGGV